MLGVRDYARNTGFRSVLLGLSGGVDPAITAAIAADALGPEKVLGVMMPSVYSSEGSVTDSEELARNLAIRTLTLPIARIMQTSEGTLADAFRNLPADVAGLRHRLAHADCPAGVASRLTPHDLGRAHTRNRAWRAACRSSRR